MIASHFQTLTFYSLIVAAILLAMHLYVENQRIVRFGNKLPGPRKLPLLGHVLFFIGLQPNNIMEKGLQYNIYGPVVKAFILNKLYVFLYHPRDVELILKSTVNIEKSADYDYFKPWLGNGLLISSGEKWRQHRKIIAPTFHQSILKTFVPFFYQNSRDLVIRLREKVGKEFDCHDYMSGVTVDILLDTAMGMRATEKCNNGYEYATAVMDMCDIIHRRHFNMQLRSNIIFNCTKNYKRQAKLLETIHKLSWTVIKKKKEEYYQKYRSTNEDEDKSKDQITPVKDLPKNEKEEPTRMHYINDDLDEIDENDVGEKKRLAFLDLMIEMSRNGTLLTEEEVREEVDTIMFEGHDTTAAASSFVLCLLGIHQDVQNRVHEELDEIFEGTNRVCTFEDTLRMKYLERVILETLRMFPPVPLIARTLNEDVQLVTGNYVLPKGATAIILPFLIHRLEEFYPNALKFDPDNFLPEKSQNRHYYSFIPFSAGPRSCVGRKYAMLKLKVLLSTVLRNYRILSDLTEKDFWLKVDIILKRVDGFRIKIEPRNKSREKATV
ncbi:cytochrome P450 4g15-like [Xylocopa sonorina]|uniref:cytochrome P450 4g15-like n=1 Tax=Xylocopa sonorina TaxID=1818115 RepID=UPI00403A8066